MPKKKTPQEIAAESKTAGEALDKMRAQEQPQQQTWRLGNQVFTNERDYRIAQSLAGITKVGEAGFSQAEITPQAKLAAEEFKLSRAQGTPELLTPKQQQEVIDIELKKGEQPQELPSIEEMKKGEQARLAESEQTGITGKNIPERIPQAAKFINEGITNFVPNLILGQETKGGVAMKKTLAEIYDTIHSALTRKKPLKFVNAKEGLDFALKDYQGDIAAVKLNQKSYIEVLQKLQDGTNNLVRMEAAAKGFGAVNLNWWIDDGISIQAEIASNLDLLNNLRADLIQARDEARINEIKTRYGMK